MKNFAIAVLCLSLATAVLQAFSPQEPAAEKTTTVVLVPPARTPVWNTFTLRNDSATTLLVVPHGKRFVLTDLWTMEDDYLPGKSSDDDRVWLESVGRNGRRLVFDAKFASLPSPMTWVTGPVFDQDSQMVMLYKFVDEDNNELVRRVHFTGYFEELEKDALGG